MRNWYVLKDGEVQGPFDREHIQRMVWTGKLKPDDPVTCDRFPYWYPARDITGLEFPQSEDESSSGDDQAATDALPSPTAGGVPLPPAGGSDPSEPVRRQPAPAAAAIPTTPRSLPIAVPVPPLPPENLSGDETDGTAASTASRQKRRIIRRRAPQSNAASRTDHQGQPAPASTGSRTTTPSPDAEVRTKRRKKRKRRSPPEVEIVSEHNNDSGLATAAAIEAAPGINIDWEAVGKTILVLLALTILSMPVVVWRVWRARHRTTTRISTGLSRMDLVELAGEALGTYLALKSPGGRAMLVVPPKDSSDYDAAVVAAARAGLQKGFGKEVRIIGEASPQMSLAKKLAWEKETKNSDHTPALRYWLDAASMDEVLGKCSDADVIVSLVGLPEDLDMMSFWRTPEAVRPMVAVLLGRVPTGKTIRALRAGWIAAAVDYSPGPRIRYPFLTPDTAQRFGRACRLVTSENVKVLARMLPDLFAR